MLAQIGSATLRLICFQKLGLGYLAGGTAMVLAIGMMILTDSMHPPAVASALSFGLKSGDESNLLLFRMAVGITTALVIIERTAILLLRRSNAGREERAKANYACTFLYDLFGCR